MVSAISNAGARFGARQLGESQRALGSILERLASGKRINRAADDPSGLIAVEGLKSKEIDLTKQIESITRRQYEYGAMEGGLSVISDLLVDLQGLVTNAGNRSALSADEKRGLQEQADGIVKAIDFLAGTGRLSEGGSKLIGGGLSLGAYTTITLGRGEYQISDGNGGTRTINGSLNELRSGGAFDLEKGDVEGAQKALEKAAAFIGTTRGAYGAQMKAIDDQVSALQVELENTVAAKGQILDTDYAKETAALVRERLKQEAATFVTSVSQQQQADAVLSLLSGTKELIERSLEDGKRARTA